MNSLGSNQAGRRLAAYGAVFVVLLASAAPIHGLNWHAGRGGIRVPLGYQTRCAFFRPRGVTPIRISWLLSAICPSPRAARL